MEDGVEEECLLKAFSGATVHVMDTNQVCDSNLTDVEVVLL